MDVGQVTFQNLYRAVKLLTGVAASKAVGAPGLLSMLLNPEAAVGVAPGVTTLAAVPALELGIHSAHALVLFNALRSASKYGDMRDQLRAIQKAMDDFIKAIEAAIRESSPVPDSPPSADAAILFDGKKMAKFMEESNAWVAMVKSFVENLDAFLDDITRCLNAWNDFLAKFRKFMQADKPRNVFEALDHASLNQERDWAWYSDETGFSAACNSLLSHRNKYAKLIGVAARSALPSLNFAE